MPSSISTARANLYTALAALTAVGQSLEGWQVTFGPPEVHTEQHKVIALLGVEDITTDDATLGGTNYEETYAILLRGKVHDPACNGDPAELQAIDSDLWSTGYETVRATVQADRTLDGALNMWATVATAEAGRDTGESPVPAENRDGTPWGWVAFADWRVVCRSRIT